MNQLMPSGDLDKLTEATIEMTYFLASSLWHLEQYEEAEDVMREFIELYPENQRTPSFRNLLLYGTEDPESADPV